VDENDRADVQAEEGGEDEERDDREAGDEVLPDDAAGGAAEPHGERRRPRSSLISAMSQVSNATVEPAAPIAMPTSARAIAGASLTPSPTIAMGRWVSARRVI
jgi:hypothetical protein